MLTQDVDAATDMVLDRAFQRPRPKAKAAPASLPPQQPSKSRRDSAREGWEAQYDQVEETEATVEIDEDEEMNLATLLNVIDGQVFYSLGKFLSRPLCADGVLANAGT